jgi:periplasmic divalent cation tolerance protein
MTAIIVFSTFPSDTLAREAASKLIEQRVAACVSILPGMASIYRWEGRVEASEEVLLIIKTTKETYPQLESALKACHPYELPEILAVASIAGLPEYLQWVMTETARHNEEQ